MILFQYNLTHPINSWKKGLIKREKLQFKIKVFLVVVLVYFGKGCMVRLN